MEVNDAPFRGIFHLNIPQNRRKQMSLTLSTQSFHLTFEDTIRRLCASDTVVGLALFGSRVQASENPSSDYDLLILVREMPVEIFQMFTSIEGRLADIVFANTQTVDHLMHIHTPIHPYSKEGMLLQKMLTAKIVYDPSVLLLQVQKLARERQQLQTGLLSPSESDQYAAWFWQNHSLVHIRRMLQSEDPVVLTAVDLMLLSGISRLGRDYYTVRSLFWEGEKGAVRFLQSHNTEYLILLRNCLAEPDRVEKVKLYEQLVEKTIAPIGMIWAMGDSAVYLRNLEEQPGRVREALAFWEELFESL
jgi:predicted nucleotidyltransferase